MDAVITAGGRVTGPLAQAMGTSCKALAPLGKRRLLDGSVAAAFEAGAQRITIVAGDEVRAAYGARTGLEFVDAVEDGRENLRRALTIDAAGPLLFLTSDLPFVSGSAVRAFLERSGATQVAMPLSEAASYADAYPGAPDHVTKVGSERVVNASVFFFAPGAAARVSTVAQDFFNARKSLWRMAALTGPSLLLRFALGTLRIPDLERKAERVLGLSARAIRGCDPSLCYDIDTLEDYRYALGKLHGD